MSIIVFESCNHECCVVQWKNNEHGHVQCNDETTTLVTTITLQTRGGKKNDAIGWYWIFLMKQEKIVFRNK